MDNNIIEKETINRIKTIKANLKGKNRVRVSLIIWSARLENHINSGKIIEVK